MAVSVCFKDIVAVDILTIIHPPKRIARSIQLRDECKLGMPVRMHRKMLECRVRSRRPESVIGASGRCRGVVDGRFDEILGCINLIPKKHHFTCKWETPRVRLSPTHLQKAVNFTFPPRIIR